MNWGKVIDKLRELETTSRHCAAREAQSLESDWVEDVRSDRKLLIERHALAAYIFGGLANALHAGMRRSK